jgi:serine/threonine protein kinase
VESVEEQTIQIAHVLSVGLVGVDLAASGERQALATQLQEAVRCTPQYLRTHHRGAATLLPTDDGAAVAFFDIPDTAICCALELMQLLVRTPRISARIGVHSGPLNFRQSQGELSGNGPDVARRVMECGSRGHILVSQAIFDFLDPFGHWGELLHLCGEVELGGGSKLQVFNLFSADVGNQQIPTCFLPTEDDTRDPMIGRSIRHYVISEKLGDGGMGVVYKAKDVRLDRNVAIKFLSRDLARNKAHLDRFQREARAASRLNHPNICTIHDVGEEDGSHYIVMELLEGKTLRQLIHDGALEPKDIVEYGIAIANALHTAHSNGVIHRDIKPANIFVNQQGQVKVLDFGLAKLSAKRLVAEAAGATVSIGGGPLSVTESSVTSLGELVGTVSYMSPEQARGLDLDIRTDIFSFGVVIYQMAAGVLPFRGDTSAVIFDAILNRAPVSPVKINPLLPPGLERIINRALEKQRERRYQSALEICADLQQLSLAPHGSGVQRMVAPVAAAAGEVVLLYKRNAQPDEQLLRLLEGELQKNGYRVFIDRHLQVGMEWAREIEKRISQAEAVIPLVSESSAASEMMAYEIQIAHEAAQKQNGKPRILPVRVNFLGVLAEPVSSILSPLHYAEWKSTADNSTVLPAVLNSLRNPSEHRSAVKLESVGGAVPLDSSFYIVRPTDDEFLSAISRNDSVILIKGARQMGKTSLLARGLSEARKSGSKVVLTDFQKLNSAHLENINSFFLALAENIVDQLEFDDVLPEKTWSERRGPSMNFDRFVRREILKRVPSLVWGMDEVDRLFSTSFASEAFGLFRAWHNERSLDPSGPWQRLTMAIAYATEAHLFITDINQSPFNVGTRLSLEDFNLGQVGELNRRYGNPLSGPQELENFFELLGGHPYLTRRGLHEMATHGISFEDFAARASRDEGPFGDHLRRILVMLAQDAEICNVVREILAGRVSGKAEDFYRLRSSGIVSGESGHDMRLRCRLYDTYLKLHLS